MFSSSPICVHSHVWALSFISSPHFIHYWSVQNPLRSRRVVPPKLESVCEFGLWSKALISIFLDWHQQLLCMLITMVTLLSGWQPLCCQRSTQANEAAIIMMFPSPPPLFACFFPSLTDRNKQPLQLKLMTFLPDLFSFTRLLMHTQMQLHWWELRGPVLLSPFTYWLKFYGGHAVNLCKHKTKMQKLKF